MPEPPLLQASDTRCLWPRAADTHRPCLAQLLLDQEAQSQGPRAQTTQLVDSFGPRR